MARTNIALTAEVSGSAIVGLEPNRKDSIRDGRVRVGVSNATSPDTLSHVPAATSEPNRRQLRLMARNVPDKERNKLYKEHAELVWKDVSSGLTSDENCRLNIVKWMLEQIEAAEVGPGLDQLEQVAELIDAQARSAQVVLRCIERTNELYGLTVKKAELTGKDGAPLLPRDLANLTDEELDELANTAAKDSD